jgi:phosphoglycerol transferase
MIGEDTQPAVRSVAILTGLVAISFALLVMKGLYFANPIVFADEYVSKSLAKHAFDYSLIFARESELPRWNVSNIVYLATFHLCYLFREHFYELAKVLNSLFFSLAAFPVYGTARIFVSRRTALLIAGLSLISSYGSYTVYFMPEAMYYFLFCMLVYFLVTLIGRRTVTSGTLCGVTLGTMFMVKPHAIVLLVALNVVLGVAILMRRRFQLQLQALLTAIMSLDVMFVAVIATVNWLLLARVSSSMFFVGDVYRGVSRELISASGVAGKLGDMLFVGVGHVVFFAVVCLVPLLATVRQLLGMGVQDPRAFEKTIALLFGVVGILFLIAVTIKFTFNPAFGKDEIFRVNARYYLFMVPLFLMALYDWLEKRPRSIERRGLLWPIASTAGGVGLVVAFFMIMPRYRILMVDFPDVCWIPYSDPRVAGVLIVSAAVVALYYGLSKCPRALVFSVFYLCISTAGNVAAFKGQRFVSAAYDEPSDAARTISNLLAASELNDGVVFAKQYGGSAYAFLFGFSGTPYLVDVRSGGRIGREQIPAAARWVLALDEYKVDMPLVDSVRGRGFHFGRLPRNVSEVDAEPGPPARPGRLTGKPSLSQPGGDSR